MTRLAPHTVALTDQALAALAAEFPLPISTPALHARLSPPCDGWPHTSCQPHLDYGALSRTLNRLARAGDVEKIPPEPGMRANHWRRWPAAPDDLSTLDPETRQP